MNWRSAVCTVMSICLLAGGVAQAEVASFPIEAAGSVGLPPTIPDFYRPFNTLGEVITIQAIDTNPGTPPVTWSATLTGPVYVPNFGAVPGAPGLGSATFSWDPATQAFEFNTLGATRGNYTWTGSATNDFGSDPFTIYVNVVNGIDGLFPEPSTVTLLVLAVLGIVTGARRR